MAAYTPYDLLRTLVERVGWPDEAQKRVALASIGEWESMSVFGNLVRLAECKHESVHYNGRCEDCGLKI